MIIVLLTVGFVSFVSVLFVQYTRWQSNLSPVPRESLQIQEALRYGRSKVHNYFRDNLTDTGVVEGTVKFKWERNPSITIETQIRALNGKLNINKLIQGQNAENISLLESAFDELNYPSRAVDELEQWMGEDDESNVQYAGYGYRVPERKVYHRDELTLVSGFIQLGLSDQFNELFTVYGSGRFNPLHLTPREWRLLKSLTGIDLPDLPDRATRSQQSFRNFIRQEGVWSRIKDQYSFMTRKDDSFQVSYRIESGPVKQHYREIYVYNYLTDTLKVQTSFPLFQWEKESLDI